MELYPYRLREKSVSWQNMRFKILKNVTDYFTYYISDCGKDLPEARDVLSISSEITLLATTKNKNNCANINLSKNVTFWQNTWI